MIFMTQRLGEDVSHIVFSRDVGCLQSLALNQLSNKVVADLNVFRPAREGCLLGERDSTFIVTPQSRRGILRVTK